MNLKTLLILSFLLCLQASIVSASEIIVKGADNIWKADQQYLPELRTATTEVLPRISVEHASSVSKLENTAIPAELSSEAAEVSSRMIVEHASSTLKFDNTAIPTELVNKTAMVQPRIIIEHATSALKIDLVPFPPGLVTKQMEMQALPDKLIADGYQTAQITVTLKDEFGNPVVDETVEITATLGQVSKVKNNGDGTYSATYTAEKKSGQVTLTATATKAKISKSATITLISCGVPVFKATLILKKGINMISLPLNPNTSYTASTLAAELNSTIIIQVENGSFDAYVHTGQIGNDFDIQMGKGYIVNLMEAQTFNITGKPWGEPVPATPSISASAEPWAFVVAGQIEGTVPDNGRLRITNLHTGEKLVASISPSGQFTAAFVDMNRRPVIAKGDEIIIQLIDMRGVPLTESKRYIISHQELDQAYLLVYLSTKIEQTKLLQNYPNPFNPETWIPFRLAENLEVKIRIYDIQGRLVRELALGRLEAGVYERRDKSAYWDGRNEHGEQVASGVYIYQMVAGKNTFTRRMVVLK